MITLRGLHPSKSIYRWFARCTALSQSYGHMKRICNNTTFPSTSSWIPNQYPTTMPASVQQQTAYFTALIVRATLYGLYIASSVHCFRWLLFDDQGRKLRKRINWRLTSVAVFIFCFLTTTLGVTSRAALDLIPGDLHSAVLSIVKVRLHNELLSTMIAPLR
jgi:hypothetical protein